MIPRLIELLRRLLVIERIALLLVVMLPVAVGVALAIEVILGLPRAAILISTGFYLVMIVVVAIAAIARAMRWRRFVAEQQRLRELGSLDSPLADLPTAWLKIASGQLDSARVIRDSANLPAMSVFAFGARSRSTWVRELYAFTATRGRLGFDDLTDALRAAADDPSLARVSVGDPSVGTLLGLARLLISRASSDQDRDLAELYLAYLAQPAQRARLSVADQVLLSERLVLVGRADLARPMVETWSSEGLVQAMLAADVLNPFGRRSSRSTGSEKSRTAMTVWLSAFNAVNRVHGLEGISLDAEGATPYDRLHASVGDAIDGGPMVSIVMSCLRPDESLFTALRSATMQSWRNWELLLIDDGSGPGYDAVFEQAAAMDPRVRVIRSDLNLGTYARRNEGILAARGEFVTMQDADDWAHPRRLEIQLRHLIAHPEFVANTSPSLRVSEQLIFVQPRGTKLRLTETSLMFRRDQVTARIGFYDTLRKAADSEFRLRIEAAFGVPVPLLIEVGPLSLIRFSGDSLSGSDLGDGWMHPARAAYQSGFRSWHRRIAAGTSDPFLAYPLSERPFPVHNYLLGEQPANVEVDVVVALDGRPGANPPEHLDGVAREISDARDAGLSIAILHLDSLHADSSVGVFGDELQDLVSSGRATRVLDADHVRARLVLVRNVSALQGALEVPTGIRGERTILIEDVGSRRDQFGSNFAWRDVDNVARVRFGGLVEHQRTTGRLDYAELLSQSGEREDPAGAVVLPSRNAARDAEILAELYSVAGPRDDEGLVARTEPDEALAVVEAVADLATEGTVVYIGDGVVTPVWMALAVDRGSRAKSVDVLCGAPESAAALEDLLGRNGVADRVRLRLAAREAIEDGDGRREWLERDAWESLTDIRLLVVEGLVGQKAEYIAPAHPFLEPALADEAIVILSHPDRDSQLAVLRSWLGQGRQGTIAAMRTVGAITVLSYRRRS